MKFTKIGLLAILILIFSNFINAQLITTLLYSEQATYGEWVETNVPFSSSAVVRIGGIGISGSEIQGFGGKIRFRIPSPKMQPNSLHCYKSQGHCFKPDRLWGGIYDVSIQETPNTVLRHSSITILGGDAIPTDPVLVNKYELNILRCDGGSGVADLLGNTSITKPLREFQLRGKGPCGCKLYEVGVDLEKSESGKTIGQFLHDLKPKFGFSKLTSSIDLQVTRVLAYHGVYSFGPDRDPEVIEGIDSANLLPKPSNNPLPNAVLAILDSGVEEKSGIFDQPSAIRLTQASLPDDRSATGTETSTDAVLANPDPDPKGTPYYGGHGTPIAWLASQGRNPNQGSMLHIRSEPVCDKYGHCKDSKIIRGICDAVKYRDSLPDPLNVPLVINMSLFSPTPSKALRTVLQYALSTTKKTVVVAAAGNATTETRESLLNKPNLLGLQGMYPAGYAASIVLNPNREAISGFTTPLTLIFGVGSMNGNEPVETSIPGAHVKFAVQGRSLKSYDPYAKSLAYSGTSFATALTSAAFLRLITGYSDGNDVSRSIDANSLYGCLNRPANPSFTRNGLRSSLVGLGRLDLREPCG
jgi:hypothetical protein